MYYQDDLGDVSSTRQNTDENYPQSQQQQSYVKTFVRTAPANSRSTAVSVPLAQRFEELLNLRVSEPEARLQESLEEAALMEERARAALEGMKAQLMQRDRDIAKMQREMETLRQEMKAQKAEVRRGEIKANEKQVAETHQVQLKLNTVTSLSGLSVLSVSRTDAGDTLVLMRARNTLSARPFDFSLMVDSEEVEYSPSQDSLRSHPSLPVYLQEDISFDLDQAPVFFSRLVSSLSKMH